MTTHFTTDMHLEVPTPEYIEDTSSDEGDDDDAPVTSRGVDYDVDPLVDLVQQYPQDGVRFLQIVMMLGSVSAIVVAIPTGVFLFLNWALCAPCSRPFHVWLLVHSILQLVQAPVRLEFFGRLKRLQRQNAAPRNIQRCVAEITDSQAWKLSKTASMLNYVWLVLGVSWILNFEARQPYPGAYDCCAAALAVALARVVISISIYRWSFASVPTDALTEVRERKPRARGASQMLIDSLEQFEFDPEEEDDDGWEEGCAVCLCDFETGCTLRRLPCGHRFHGQCIDKWLRMNKRCPLCNHAVDVQAKPLGCDFCTHKVKTM